jgi:hypothetical protein
VKPKHEGLLNELLAQALASRLTSMDQYFSRGGGASEGFPSLFSSIGVMRAGEKN